MGHADHDFLDAELSAALPGVGVLFGAALVGVLFEIIPQLTATPTTGVNQAPTILAGFLAILTLLFAYAGRGDDTEMETTS